MHSVLHLRLSDGDLDLFLGETRILHHSARLPLVSVGLGHPRIRASHGNSRIRAGLVWKRPDDRHAILELSGREGTTVRFSLTVDDQHPALVRAQVSGEAGFEHNRLWIRLPAQRREPTYGCGEQFSRFNLRGSRVPLWTGEQGVGRGFNVTTLAANLHSGSGGHWHSTYFPQPSYVTEAGRVVHVETDAYSRFSFESTADVLEVWEAECSVILGAAGSLGSAVQTLSGYLGRQPRLPEWTHDGMWLGLQGGGEIVRAKVGKAQDAGIPLSAVWVQDWVGRRVTSFGSQLFWDWRYDRDRYPDLPGLTQELGRAGVRFLGYINPFLAIEGELYKEARDRGYCIKKPDGSDYLITVTTFPAAKVDLSNPEAWAWLKEIIQRNMLDAGLSGWMADYGEYLPADAVLAGADPMRFHNRYPAEWARLNYEAVAEAGRIDDVVIFMRAGYTGSSRHAHSIWAGDQMVDWSRHDGLPSVIPAALSSGVVGIGVHHSDLGGFTSLFGKKRTKALFMRWAEHSAFTPIMRSHESNRPDQNWQWDGDADTIQHLDRMAKIYVALAPYRRAALEEYYATGLPAMRPVVLHYPDSGAGDRGAGDYGNGRPVNRYLLGRDLLVQPVVRPGVQRVSVDLPEDSWVHLWSDRRFPGGRATVDAPFGRPPVFYRVDSSFAELFAGMVDS